MQSLFLNGRQEIKDNIDDFVLLYGLLSDAMGIILPDSRELRLARYGLTRASEICCSPGPVARHQFYITRKQKKKTKKIQKKKTHLPKASLPIGKTWLKQVFVVLTGDFTPIAEPVNPAGNRID